MAKRLGISHAGYPNIAVYGPGDEYLGRIVGFGGTDSWFSQLKAVQAVGDELAELRRAAEEDPARWMDVAAAVAAIPDRSDDALQILEKIPEAQRDTDAFRSMKARLEADAAWLPVKEKLKELLQGVRSKDAAVEKAPVVFETVDGYLAAHDVAGSDGTAGALTVKAFFLHLTDQRAEAIEVARKLLGEHPESSQVDTILSRLPWQ